MIDVSAVGRPSSVVDSCGDVRRVAARAAVELPGFPSIDGGWARCCRAASRRRRRSQPVGDGRQRLRRSRCKQLENWNSSSSSSSWSVNGRIALRAPGGLKKLPAAIAVLRRARQVAPGDIWRTQGYKTN
jgi:hypothetical protein